MKIDEIVFEAGYFTIKDAALLVGRSEDTLRRWIRSGEFIPSNTMQFGSLKVYVYTRREIEMMRELTKMIHPGRPPSGGR